MTDDDTEEDVGEYYIGGFAEMPVSERVEASSHDEAAEMAEDEFKSQLEELNKEELLEYLNIEHTVTENMETDVPE